MATKNKRKWWDIRKVEREDEGEEKAVTIHVRRNGSRYIELDELLQSDEFEETVKDLESIKLSLNTRSDS